MGRFGYYQSDASRRLARSVTDWLAAQLDAYHRERRFGEIVVRVRIEDGEPTQAVVTPGESWKASALTDGSEE